MKRLFVVFSSLLVLIFLSASAKSDVLFLSPVNAGPGVNTEFSEGGASLSADNLTLFFSSNRPGGLGNHDLYMSTRSTMSGPFGAAINLGATINSSFSDLPGGISNDGLSLFFVSTRDSPNGQGDIFLSTRVTTSDAWGDPTRLSVSSVSDDGNPEISADGLTLYFQSLRTGSFGSYDLWAATRSDPTAAFDSPVNLGSTVNSSFNDGGPSISSDSLSLFFSSNRPGGGQGAFSIWTATRSSINDPFTTVSSFPVNSEFDGGQPHISRDGSIFLFQSTRPGGFGNSDIWISSAVPEPTALTLLGIGAVTLLGYGWRRKRTLAV